MSCFLWKCCNWILDFSGSAVIGFLRMSQGHEPVTVDFLGIQKSKESNSEIKYRAPCLDEKPIHCIKPPMVQDAFSSRGLTKQYCKAQRDPQDPVFEAASRIMKELFPKHTGRGSNPTAQQNITTLIGNSSVACRSAYRTPPGEQSAAQLTIFYNGMLNVYDVSEKQAADIIRLAGNENSFQQWHSANFDLHVSGQKPITISSTGRNNQREEPLPLNLWKNSNPQQLLTQTLHTELPLQRKQSLQRFLQNRKEYRMNRAVPYSHSNAAKD